MPESLVFPGSSGRRIGKQLWRGRKATRGARLMRMRDKEYFSNFYRAGDPECAYEKREWTEPTKTSWEWDVIKRHLWNEKHKILPDLALCEKVDPVVMAAIEKLVAAMPAPTSNALDRIKRRSENGSPTQNGTVSGDQVMNNFPIYRKRK